MKYSLALLAALLSVSAVSSFPTPLKVEIPPQCADPTYACQDIESARECGVVKSCINDIWSTMGAPDDNNEICDICKEMVKEARDQLLSNMTQEEIKEVFEGSCKLLPVKIVTDECIKVVDEIIPELVEMLASRMDPNMVCTVSGLCNVAHLSIKDRAVPVILHMVVSSVNDNKCDQCTSLVTQIKDFVSSETESDLKNMVINFCDKEVSSFVCKELVNMYFSQVYQFIISADPESVCESIGVCPTEFPRMKEHSNLKDNLTCEFCENVLEHIKQIIIANTTEDEFRTALLHFCSDLGRLSEKCTNLVNDYFDMLYDFIRKLDTQKFCAILGLCESGIVPLVKMYPAENINTFISMAKILPAFPNTENPDIQPLVNIFPAEALSKKEMKISNADSNDIFDTSANIQLPINRLSHPTITFERDTECAFCRAITFYLKTDLNGDRSKNGVRNALDNVCDRWVKEYPEHCQSFVQKYSQKVLFEVETHNDFDTICSNVKACPLEDKNTGVSLKVIPPAPESDDNVVCDLCKEVLNTIDDQLKNASTKESIKQCLDKVCNIVPASLKEKCQELIENNIDVLFTVLIQELDPDNACPALRLCPKSNKSVPTIVKDIECDLCKQLVKELQTELQSPETMQALKGFLETMCSKLPSSLEAECKKFVDDNIDELINILVQELDTVCVVLNICPETLKKLISPVPNNLECDLCKEIVQEVENELKDQKTEEAIRKALDKVCSVLPQSISVKCQQFVDTYTNLLITLLAEEMDPDMVCAALNVCPANVQHLREWHSKAADVECKSCQYFLTFLQQQLMNSDTQAELKNAIKRVCDLLPGGMAQNCDAFVDEYGSALLTLIAQELDPNSTCSELGMCPASKVVQKLPEPMTVKSLNFDECSVCTTVVDYLDKLLEEDDVDKEITSLIEKVCNVVPASIKDKCTSVIEAYGPYLLQMIGQLADSKQVCQDIDLCARPAGHVHLLGGEKCIFGPNYWCKSNAHATACKAVTYCRQNVWKTEDTTEDI